MEKSRAIETTEVSTEDSKYCTVRWKTVKFTESIHIRNQRRSDYERRHVGGGTRRGVRRDRRRDDKEMDCPCEGKGREDFLDFEDVPK